MVLKDMLLLKVTSLIETNTIFSWTSRIILLNVNTVFLFSSFWWKVCSSCCRRNKSIDTDHSSQDKTSSQILGVVLPSKHGDKPKRGNSTALFFRKFYHLGFVRLQDLCKNLGVEDEILRKIWTWFQQAIVNYVEELIKRRHLDQIVMCCVYVVSKVWFRNYKRTNSKVMTLYFHYMFLLCLYLGCGKRKNIHKNHEMLSTTATTICVTCIPQCLIKQTRRKRRSHQIL